MIRKALIVLSIALLTATLGVWISSYWRGYWCDYRYPRVVNLSLIYGAGYVRFSFAPFARPDNRPIGLEIVRVRPPVGRSWCDRVPGFLPLRFFHRSGDFGGPGLTVAMPFWLLCVFLGSYPGWYVLVQRIREREQWRWRRGLCGACAYDLTGNESGVCPECGTRIQHP